MLGRETMRCMSDYRKSASKRPPQRKRLVDPFSAKVSIIRNKRHPVEQEHNQTPLPHGKRPLFSRVLGRRPWAEQRNRFSEGNGVVSEAGKGVFYLERCFVWVDACVAQEQHRYTGDSPRAYIQGVWRLTPPPQRSELKTLISAASRV